VVPATPALAQLDHPPSQSRSFAVHTAYGTCQFGGTTDAVPSPAPIGAVTTGTWTDCTALSITPRLEWVRSSISGTGVTVAGGQQTTEQVCSSAKWCSLVHSWRPLPPGDYSTTHRMDVDLTPGGTSGTYWLSYPPDCRLSNNDSGYLFCSFQQAVTYLPVALP
jgi:hypothetical protein